VKKSRLKGRLWVLCDSQGQLLEDIDTDQIYHNAYLYITDVAQMGQYALGSLKGWKDFSRKASAGDIIVAGRNFGAGSSRQQAVDCFISLGISMIMAPSFGAIYFRNAVNSGFPVLRSAEIESLVRNKELESGDIVKVDFRQGQAINITKKISFTLESMSDVQYQIYLAGGLFRYGRKLR